MSEQKEISKQVRLNLFGALKGLDCNRFICDTCKHQVEDFISECENCGQVLSWEGII